MKKINIILGLLICISFVPGVFAACVLSPVYDAYVEYDTYYNLTLSSSGCTAPVTYSMTNIPGTNSTISWKPGFMQKGNYTVNYSVTGTGGYDSIIRQVYVYDTLFKHFNDTFSNAVITDSFFTNSTNSTATLTHTGTALTATELTTADGAYITPNSSFSVYTVSVGLNITTLSNGNVGLFAESQPIGFGSLNTNHSIFQVMGDQSTGKLLIGMYATNDAWLSWNSTSGQMETGVHGITAALKTNYTFIIKHNISHMKGIIYNKTGSILLESDWIPLSSIKHTYSDNYIGIGEFFNNSRANFTLTNFSVGYDNVQSIQTSVQYRAVSDGLTGKNTTTVINLLSGLLNNIRSLIFQAHMVQYPMYNYCSNYSTIDLQNQCNALSYSYQYLNNTTTALHTTLPRAMVGGGFLMEFINKTNYDPITNITYSEDQTWNLTPDPKTQYGLSMNRTQFQGWWAKGRGWTTQAALDNGSYVPKRDMFFYYPNVTNQTVQTLYLNLAKAQINNGIDFIWCDMCYATPEIYYNETGDINNVSVNETFLAVNSILNNIHNYSIAHGNYVYLVSWGFAPDYSVIYTTNLSNPLDGYMTSPTNNEIVGGINDAKWTTVSTGLRTRFGQYSPIFARIDYGSASSPLAVFSQYLTTTQARVFLVDASTYYASKNIQFIYPIYGGNMAGLGDSPAKLSYGSVNWYDSQAPEFDTFVTIQCIISGICPPPPPPTLALQFLNSNCSEIIDNSYTLIILFSLMFIFIGIMLIYSATSGINTRNGGSGEIIKLSLGIGSIISGVIILLIGMYIFAIVASILC